MKSTTITFQKQISDIADKFMPDGAYKQMRNCRPNDMSNKSGAVVTKIKSNKIIDDLSFGASVEFIGSCQDNKRNAIISFYRDVTTLYITSLDISTSAESYLLKSTQIDFSRRVTHAGVMDDYLWWIDGAHKLRKFNINNASDTLNAFSPEELSIDKLPPLYPPTIVASEDIGNVSNNISNTIFQYAYSFQYEDGEKSSWSPISKSGVPISDNDEDKTFPNNLHTLTVETGSSNVSKILIAARKGEDRDFLLIDTLDKEDESISDNTTYEYAFYNNRATTGLVQSDVISNTFNPYYYFKSMAIANDNFLALGGIKDGLENTDVSLSLDYVRKTPVGRFSGQKTGSTQGYGLLFRDENGRTAGVCAETTIDIPSLPALKIEDNTTIPRSYVNLDWVISGSAPLWASTVSLVYLGNLSMSYFIQHLIGDIYDRQDYTYIDISPLNLAAQQGSTTDITASAINIEPYVWQKGDRIRFLTNTTDSVLITEIDEEVRGYVPEKTDAGGNVLYTNTIYIDKFDWESQDIGKYSKYEIYRPKKEFNDKIYYETGNVYEVINGVIQTISGQISEGDIWRRERTYDTRQLGELSVSPDWTYSEYQGSDIILPLSAVGEVDGLQNTDSGNTPFYIAPLDSTITLSGSFKYSAQWDKDYSRPVPKFFISRPGSNNNESIDIPYTFTSIDSTADWLDAGIFQGTIDYPDIDMPEGSSIYMSLRVINKHRVEVFEGSQIFFNILVQDEEDKFVDFYVEDINYSDYFDSDEHSLGRPYTVLDVINPDRLLNNIVTTGNYFADTEIDETNKIDSTVTYIPYQYGDIEALRVVGDVLKTFTRSKEISIYLGRQQALDASGNTQVSYSSSKLGTINVPTSDYGTVNPESIMINGRSMYYYDSKNNAIVASHPNGQDDISERGYKTYLIGQTSLVDAAASSNVYIGYNDKNKEILVTFVYDGSSETAVYNQRDMIWTHHLDLTDSANNPNEGFAHLGQLLLAYRGHAYLNEEGTGNLNLFGDNKTASITGVINAEPISTKVLQSMSYQSNEKWDVSIESEPMEGWPYGQYTEITSNRQVSKESILFSDVPFNIRKKDGTINRLFFAKGTPMRCRVAIFTMSSSTSTDTQLDEVSFIYIPSATQ